MSNDLHPGRLTALALLYGRLSLGAYFLLAGWGKIQGGVGEFVEGTYRSMTPEWLPEVFAGAYGHALPFLELAAGLGLAIGLLGRLSALGIALMLLSFLIVSDWSAGPGPFPANAVMLGLALVLVATGPGRASVDAVLARKRAD